MLIFSSLTLAPVRNKELIQSFGARLRKLRNEKNYSQQQLADEAEMSKATIVKIEAGKMNCSLDIILTLSKVLEVGAEEMLRDL